jgi:uncharacterized membrane protein YeaQ/YmgE (transglycosylase-associated protein family)
MGYLISLVISGLIIGALGRLAVPGPNPMGCIGTIAVGILGSLLGGLVARAIWGPNFVDHGIGVVVLEVLGAALIVFLVGSARRRR